jgi:hypothetical protein
VIGTRPIDDDLLNEVGLLLLPDEVRLAMLEHIAQKLNQRTIQSLRKQMSDEQSVEFDRVRGLGGEPVRVWMEKNFPKYLDTMNAEFDSLCDDIKAVAGQILSDEGIGEAAD